MCRSPPQRGAFCLLRVICEGLMDLLWPPRTECLTCQGTLDSASPVCARCWDSMAFPPRMHLCDNCARPLLGQARLCAECETAPPAFGHVWALGLHRGALREAIHHLKFSDREELGVPLGRLAGARIPKGHYECVVPVPLHKSRLRERGYNQAELVARGISDATGVPVLKESLIRRRSTGHQAKLDRAGRLHNLNNAFAVSVESPSWAGRRVLLVDDVLTTGATSAAAAAVIRGAGAHSVDLAVLAVSTVPVVSRSIKSS